MGGIAVYHSLFSLGFKQPESSKFNLLSNVSAADIVQLSREPSML